MDSFKINQLSSLEYDVDTMMVDTSESRCPGVYQLTRHSEEQKKNYMKTALSEKDVNFKTGFP